MSSSSSAGSNSNIITTKSLSLSANTLLTGSINNNNNNCNSNYDTVSVGSSTSSSSANGGSNTNNSNKFINSFKSLFDIFDPNNRGYIDLNELELLGANQNEILNDIICYLKQEKESLTTSLQQQQSILINTNITKTPSKTPTNVNKARNRSSLYYQTKIPYFVTFETFVNAADAVLRKRKLAKTQQKQQFQTPIIPQQQQNHQPQFLLQQFQTPIITQQQQQQQQQQSRLQYKNAIATTTSSARATTLRTNHQKTTLSDEFNSNENLAQSTTSNSTTISNLSNSTTSSNSTTIHTNVNVNVNGALNGCTNTTNIINNANSCDLNILLEQETCLLNEGLIELNKLKLYYEQKLSENELKKANILKLKHQNLFSIDKMLLNLKEITNLNTIFNSFVSKHLNTDDCDLYKIDKENLNIDYLLNTTNTNITNNNNNINTITATTNGFINTTPATVQSSAPADDANNLINTYNTYIKEKQSRIEYLQNQKSMLIRKLFEMKSMSVNNSDSTNKRQTIACPNITDKTELISGTNHVDENTKHEDFLFE